MDSEEYKSTILITTASAIIFGALIQYYWTYQTKGSKSAQSDKLPVFEQSVELIWQGTQSCFCRNKIVLNIDSTPPHTHKYYCETIAHIFGISDAKQLIIRDSETGIAPNPSSEEEWFLAMKNGKAFFVTVTDETYLTSKYKIKEIAKVIGQFSFVKQLSFAFYTRVWKDSENEHFRQTFILNSKSLEEAADNQSRWLWEMWGGKESLYSIKHGEGTIFKRMLSRHSKPRMTFDNACIWLKHMKLATLETFGCSKSEKTDLIVSLFAYWLHFLAFFQYSSKQRQIFQYILFENH